MHERIRKLLIERVGQMEAQAEIETLERATGWVVVSRDLEYDRTMLIGTFENPADALSYASSYGKELNREFGDGEGWQVDVLPLMPADALHDPRVS